MFVLIVDSDRDLGCRSLDRRHRGRDLAREVQCASVRAGIRKESRDTEHIFFNIGVVAKAGVSHDKPSQVSYTDGRKWLICRDRRTA